MESILTSIKTMLGIEEDDINFDNELIMHINSVIMDLTQMGVGPEDGYEIEDAMNTWDEFITDMKKFSGVKTYIFMRVKLIFDSSTMGSALIDSYTKQCERFEWRLNHAAESE